MFGLCRISKRKSQLDALLLLALQLYIACSGGGCQHAAKQKSHDDKPSTISPSVESGEETSDGLPPARADFAGLALLDETGATVRFKDFVGRPVIVFFGFTTCSHVCPTSLAYLAQELDLLEDTRSAVVPVFVSIDPLRDVPEKLSAFIKQFAPDIRGITGSVEDISALSEAFKPLTTNISIAPSSPDHELSHSRSFYLIDRSGSISGILPPPHQKGALANFITTHLKRSEENQVKPSNP